MEQNINRTREIRAMIRRLEQLGCVVMPPPEIEDDMQRYEKLKAEYNAHRQEQKKKSFRVIDIGDYSIEELTDSIVPACCIYGCMVEPDGVCPHGNPSVLLQNNLI